MNSEQLKGKWKQVKGDIKAQWGKLTDDDLDVIDGNVDKLVGWVQERYGDTKEAATEKVDTFLGKLRDRAEMTRDKTTRALEEAATR